MWAVKASRPQGTGIASRGFCAWVSAPRSAARIKPSVALPRTVVDAISVGINPYVTHRKLPILTFSIPALHRRTADLLHLGVVLLFPAQCRKSGIRGTRLTPCRVLLYCSCPVDGRVTPGVSKRIFHAGFAIYSYAAGRPARNGRNPQAVDHDRNLTAIRWTRRRKRSRSFGTTSLRKNRRTVCGLKQHALDS